MVWCTAHRNQGVADVPLLSCCEASAVCPVFGPQCKREVGKLEEAQRRATERAGALEYTEYEMESQLCYSPYKISVGEEGPDCFSLNKSRTTRLLRGTQ